MTENKSVFETLFEINVNDHIEKKKLIILLLNLIGFYKLFIEILYFKQQKENLLQKKKGKNIINKLKNYLLILLK